MSDSLIIHVNSRKNWATDINRGRCRDNIYPAVKNYPHPVTLPSVLSAVYRAELILFITWQIYGLLIEYGSLS